MLPTNNQFTRADNAVHRLNQSRQDFFIRAYEGIESGIRKWPLLAAFALTATTIGCAIGCQNQHAKNELGKNSITISPNQP